MFADQRADPRRLQLDGVERIDAGRHLGNLRELTEMVAKSNTEAADVLTKRIGESLTELKSSLQRTKAA